MILNIGDTVRFSKNFLGSIYSLNDPCLSKAKGIITEIKRLGQVDLCTISWNNDVPNKVIAPNLKKVK